MPKRLLPTEELAFTTIRISTVDGKGGGGSGTGFFFQFCHDGQQFVPAIVTNRHVLAGAKDALLHFSLKDASGDVVPGKLHALEVKDIQRAVLPHPNPKIDLVAIPCAEALNLVAADGLSSFFKAFGFGNLPTAAEEEHFGTMEPIIMIGYPIGIWDHVNNQPILRRGVTATHPCLDYQGRPEFVIDCACWPGSSGSPIVLYNESGFVDRDGNINMSGPRTKLLGVLYAGPQFDAEGRIGVRDIPTGIEPVSTTKVMINLGYAIKASQLRALEDEIKKKRHSG